ncbi:MAG TPA: carbohydrate ABC transporter permease [Spirochaetales bacterium]|nr:carbohydrate ABC transporter permease [Spirochaetales bacterium]HRY56332.1 carbohydrate ABC transporter permease [Spirochaetia bacterium]HRZ65583.1 carbohydrate ABC transporter permease [Spirochaetia bacterium]
MKRARTILYYAVLTLLGAATIFPFFWMALNSFKSEATIFSVPPRWVPDLFGGGDPFANYRIIFRDFNWARFTVNSAVVAGLSALGQVATCSLAGFAFASMRFKGRNLLFALLLGTMMIPVQSTIIPEFLIMMRIGWLDSYLPLIVPSVLVGSFGTFMFKEHFENVPPSFIDAASIDGAGAFSIYARVYLPMAGSQIATLAIIAFMNAWNDLLRPILYVSSEKWQTVTQALTQFQSQYSARWNLILTGSVLSVLPLLVLYVFLQRYIIQSSVSSGVKG